MILRDEELLAQLPVAPFTGAAYRHQSPGYDPMSGAGARREGGRWNPPHSFPVLYLALTLDVAAAELRHLTERKAVPLAATLPREVYRFELDLARVIDLRHSDSLVALSTSRAEILAPNQARSRQLGEAASRLDIQAIIAPSAAGVGDVLAIFADNLGASRCDAALFTTWNSIEDIEPA